MQVAEILSDLTSLRVCGHNEALALVNVHRNIPSTETQRPESTTAEAASTPADEQSQSAKKKEDLSRAKELVNLHYEVKARHANGAVDEALSRAREDVQRVLWELEKKPRHHDY